MRHIAEAWNTSYEWKAYATAHEVTACATAHDDTFPDGTSTMGPPTGLPFSRRERASSDGYKIAAILRAKRSAATQW